MPGRLKGVITMALLLIGIGGGLAASTIQVQEYRYRAYLHDSLYLPSGSFIETASLGYKELAADFVWFSAVQYYGDYRLDNHGLNYFEGLINIVTELDPNFLFAYVFGAMVISNDLGNFDKSIDLLKRGMAANPLDWELPFEIGFLHYIHHVDFDVGARYFDLASRLPDAPERASRFAGFAYNLAGSNASSIRIWEEYIETTDSPYLKEMAERYIAKIKAGESLTPVVTTPEPAAESDAAEKYNHVTSD